MAFFWFVSDSVGDLPSVTCYSPQWQLLDLFQVWERISIDIKYKIFLQEKLVIKTTLVTVTAYLSYFPWRASKCYQRKAWESCVFKNLWDWENIIALLCKNSLLQLLLPCCLTETTLVVLASQLSFGTINCSPRFFYCLLFSSDMNGIIRWMLDITLKQLKKLPCVNQRSPLHCNKHSNQLHAHTYSVPTWYKMSTGKSLSAGHYRN